MYKLIAVTVAVLYVVFLVFGDEARRPAEVARSESLGFDLVRAAALPLDFRSEPILVSEISEREAVQIAIAAGKTVREERRANPQRVAVLAADNASTTEAEGLDAPDIRYWYVTGSRVNLRGGPGTSNAVVGQVTFGTEAEVLGDQDGWYQIRLADDSASGWIFGRFLNENRPG